MSMSIAVEQIEVGDSIEVWFNDTPQAVRVSGIEERETVRSLHVAFDGVPAELYVQRGQEVTLVC